MKKIITLFLALLTAAAILTACGNSDTQSNIETTVSATQTESKAETTSEKSLVIYYDYSENIDTTGLDVDAISSASLRGGSTGKNIGNLKLMTNEAVELKNADIFSIQVNEVYPPDFEDMTGLAKDDIADGKQFTFQNELTNLEDYDTIYFGVPVWWGELPQPVHVFFQQYDFSGKTIVPFGIHHSSGFGRMVIQMNEYEPDATILDGFTIDADTDNDDVKNGFDEYLNSLK